MIVIIAMRCYQTFPLLTPHMVHFKYISEALIDTIFNKKNKIRLKFRKNNTNVCIPSYFLSH